MFDWWSFWLGYLSFGMTILVGGGIYLMAKSAINNFFDELLSIG